MAESGKDWPLIQCPHCKGEIDFDLTSKVRDKATISVTVTPHPGCHLPADVAAEAFVAFTKIVKAMGTRSYPVQPLLTGVTLNEDRSVKFTVLITKKLRNRAEPDA